MSMSIFKTNLEFNFSGISMQNKIFTESEIDQNIMYKKIRKQRYRNSNKVVNNITTIKGLISKLPEFGEIEIISKVIDSPNIILAFENEIEELYIATWAVTPAGISALETLCSNGIMKKCVVLLDKTHSYKWIFTSSAYSVLKGKVKFRFCASHCKFICLKTKNENYYNFIGSMNFTNNPRFENMRIDNSQENFEFYKDFIINNNAQEL